MQNWPIPSSQKELDSFLGLASYYRNFIPNFATISKYLHELVGPTNIKKYRKTKAKATKNSDFKWTDECQKEFDVLKVHQTSAPVLGCLDFSHPFEIETDASLKGLRAVLSQRDEHGQSKVITYASWSLCPNKKKMMKYSLAELELLALKWALTAKLWDYLLGTSLPCTKIITH